MNEEQFELLNDAKIAKRYTEMAKEILPCIAECIKERALQGHTHLHCGFDLPEEVEVILIDAGYDILPDNVIAWEA